MSPGSWGGALVQVAGRDHHKKTSALFYFCAAVGLISGAIPLRRGALGWVRERVLNFHMEAPISPDEWWELRSATSATLREKLADLSKEEPFR